MVTMEQKWMHSCSASRVDAWVTWQCSLGFTIVWNLGDKRPRKLIIYVAFSCNTEWSCLCSVYYHLCLALSLHLSLFTKFSLYSKRTVRHPSLLLSQPWGSLARRGRLGCICGIQLPPPSEALGMPSSCGPPVCSSCRHAG
jgi:hypothetical protein